MFGGRDLISPQKIIKIIEEMVEILRKQGWKLNPNDKIVNSILRMVEKNNRECPCHNTGKDKYNN